MRMDSYLCTRYVAIIETLEKALDGGCQRMDDVTDVQTRHVYYAFTALYHTPYVEWPIVISLKCIYACLAMAYTNILQVSQSRNAPISSLQTTTNSMYVRYL